MTAGKEAKWQMVPVEPTEELLLALSRGYYDADFTDMTNIERQDFMRAYRKMIAAAPPTEPRGVNQTEAEYLAQLDELRRYRLASDALDRACGGWPTKEDIAKIIAPDWFHEYTHPNNYKDQHLRFQNDALERAEKILALFSNGELTK